jgi:hypothetical protein
MKAALDFGRLGWSVIPIEPRGERPLIDWGPYQHRRAAGPEITDWFQRWPDANIAVVTGVVSDLVVLSLEPGRLAEDGSEQLRLGLGPLPETIEVSSGSGKRQLYFAHPGIGKRRRLLLGPGLVLLGDGDYAIVPPSVDASGEPYRWERSPEVCRLASAPDWLREWRPAPRPLDPTANPWRRVLEGATADECYAAITALAEHLSARDVDANITAALLLSWNASTCRPPLSEETVLTILASVAAAGAG